MSVCSSENMIWIACDAGKTYYYFAPSIFVHQLRIPVNLNKIKNQPLAQLQLLQDLSEA